MVRSYLYLFVILGSITALGWWSERTQSGIQAQRTPAQATLLGEQAYPSAHPHAQSSPPLEIEALTGETRGQ